MINRLKPESVILDRAQMVRASWTPIERLQRAIEGRQRRQEFNRLLAEACSTPNVSAVGAIANRVLARVNH